MEPRVKANIDDSHRVFDLNLAKYELLSTMKYRDSTLKDKFEYNICSLLFKPPTEVIVYNTNAFNLNISSLELILEKISWSDERQTCPGME